MISAPPFYRDEFGIGQVRMARIMSRIAMNEMGEVVKIAFGLGYENDLVRASARNRFAAARAEYERGQSILRAMGEPA